MHILRLRRQIKNVLVFLFVGSGTPYIFSGDEFGNSQKGNNNNYCQDNETSWLNWEDEEHNHSFYEFYKNVIHLRKKHPVIARHLPPAACGLQDCLVSTYNPDDHTITDQTGTLCVLFAGMREDTGEDDVIYLAINSHWEETLVRLPALPAGYAWGVVIDTSQPEGHCFYSEPRFLKQPMYAMTYRSVAVFTMLNLDTITAGDLA